MPPLLRVSPDPIVDWQARASYAIACLLAAILGAELPSGGSVPLKQASVAPQHPVCLRAKRAGMRGAIILVSLPSLAVAWFGGVPVVRPQHRRGRPLASQPVSTG
jgi:hypothetical protein